MDANEEHVASIGILRNPTALRGDLKSAAIMSNGHLKFVGLYTPRICYPSWCQDQDMLGYKLEIQVGSGSHLIRDPTGIGIPPE